MNGTEDIPLTERILGRLPRPRAAWMLLWAGLLPVVLVAAAPGAPEDFAPSCVERGEWDCLGARVSAVVSRFGPATLAAIYGVPHALWAVGKIAKRAIEARPVVEEIQFQSPCTVTVTRGIGSIAGPVMLAGVLGGLAAISVASSRGVIYLVFAPLFSLILVPQLTLLWVYLSVMLGLFRLGAYPLALEQYSGDKSLGLRPIGKLAFASYWAFVVNFAPLALLAMGGRSVVDLVVVSAFLLLGTFSVFGSLLRIRGQMAEAKRKQVARARGLYAEAYAPLRASTSLDVLQRQAPALAAAEALEKRANDIQTWPFTDALLARAVVIASSVVAALIGRVVQRVLGL